MEPVIGATIRRRAGRGPPPLPGVFRLPVRPTWTQRTLPAVESPQAKGIVLDVARVATAVLAPFTRPPWSLGSDGIGTKLITDDEHRRFVSFARAAKASGAAVFLRNGYLACGPL